MDYLCNDYYLIVPNLYGYGATDKWDLQRSQTLEDQAELIRQFIPSDGRKFSLVRYSFGGSVAMMAAKLFEDHVDKLILVEPNPFYLLKDLSHSTDYKETTALYDCINLNWANGDWVAAAAVFVDYWNSDSTWGGMDTDRKSKFYKALEPNFYEWDAVVNEGTLIMNGLPFYLRILQF